MNYKFSEVIIKILVFLFLAFQFLLHPLVLCSQYKQWIDRFDAILLALVSIAIIFVVKNKKKIFFNPLTFLSVALSLSAFISNYYSGRSFNFGFLHPIILYASAPFFSNQNRTKYSYFLKCIFYFFVSALIIAVFLQLNPNNTFFDLSENGVSIFAFYIIVFSEILSRDFQNDSLTRDKSYRLNFLFFFFLISFWAIGRVSILISGFALLCYSSYLAKNKIFKPIAIYGFILLILSFVPIYKTGPRAYFSQNSCEIVKSHEGYFSANLATGKKASFYDVTLFKTTGSYTPRYTYWLDYLEHLNSPNSIIFGNHSTSLKKLKEQYPNGEYNFHSSIIALHQRFGLVGFFIYLYLILRIIFSYFKEQRAWKAICFIFLIIRSMTDSFLFVGLWDIVIWVAIHDSNKTFNQE